MKPTIYIETTIIGYLTSRSYSDPIVATNQRMTRQWWDTRRNKYELFTSEEVVREASAGDSQAAQARMSLLNTIPSLPSTLEAERLAEELIRDGALPEKAKSDAVHVSLAAVHNLQYLLTWNCRHIANRVMLPVIRETCRRYRPIPPIICTPRDLLMENE